MPAWVTIYCRRSVARLSPDELLAGIRASDPAAPAGVDYRALAEDYDIDEDSVAPALEQLRIEAVGPAPLDYEVHYRTEGRPIVLHGWTEPARVREELVETIESMTMPSSVFLDQLRSVQEIVGIELGFTQLEDMGVVLAYELARYISQKGDGMICNDEGNWLVVREGAFEPAV